MGWPSRRQELLVNTEGRGGQGPGASEGGNEGDGEGWEEGEQETVSVCWKMRKLRQKYHRREAGWMPSEPDLSGIRPLC